MISYTVWGIVLFIVVLDAALIWGTRRYFKRIPPLFTAIVNPKSLAGRLRLILVYIQVLFVKTLAKVEAVLTAFDGPEKTILDQRLPACPKTWRGETGIFKSLWLAVRSDPQFILKCSIIFISLWFSFQIGILFADQIIISGWQILAWGLSCGLLLVVFVPMERSPIWPTRLWVFVGILAVIGFLLRNVGSGSLPPGFHVDEAGMAEYSLRHVFPTPFETINPFRVGWSALPAMYAYVLRVSMAIGGLSIAGARLSSAVAGTLAILATYFLVSQFSGHRTGLIAAVLITVYNVHIHWSRMALNNIWSTLWVPLVLAFFTWGWRRKWSGGAAFSGLALGLTAYFYPGGYIVIFLAVYLIWKTWRETAQPVEFIAYTGKMLLMGVCVALPLMVYAAVYPAAFSERAWTIFAWKPAAFQILMGGEINYGKYIWIQLSNAFGIYNILPEQSGFYTSQVPLLIGLASPLFLLGLGFGVINKQFTPILWVLYATIFGGFMPTPPPSTQHLIVVVPAVCWLVALPIDYLFARGHHYWAVFLLGMVVITDLTFYFYAYAHFPSPDLRSPFPSVPPFTQ